MQEWKVIQCFTRGTSNAVHDYLVLCDFSWIGFQHISEYGLYLHGRSLITDDYRVYCDIARSEGIYEGKT